MQSLAFLWFQLRMAQQYLHEKTFGPAQSPANSADLKRQSTPVRSGAHRSANSERGTGNISLLRRR